MNYRTAEGKKELDLTFAKLCMPREKRSEASAKEEREKCKIISIRKNA